MRDLHRCRICFTRNNLHLHHVKYRSSGGSDTPDNLITLCMEHHAEMHSDKRRWQPVLLALVPMGPLTSFKEAEAKIQRSLEEQV